MPNLKDEFEIMIDYLKKNYRRQLINFIENNVEVDCDPSVRVNLY